MYREPLRAVRAEANPDPPEFLNALTSGDELAFEELVRTNARRLHAVARRLLGNEEDAEDAVQDGLLAAYRALPRFRGQSRLSTWLHRIVVNEALMKLRRRSRKPEEPLEPALESAAALERASGATEWGDDDFLRDELRAVISEAVDRLPEPYRLVLLLRDFAEMDTAETGRALDVSPTAVKMRLHRARKALKRTLAPYLDHGLARSARLAS